MREGGVEPLRPFGHRILRFREVREPGASQRIGLRAYSIMGADRVAGRHTRAWADRGAVQRLVIAVTAASLMIACTGGVDGPRATDLSSTPGQTPGAVVPDGWTTHLVRSAGFSLAYPPRWHVTPIRSSCATLGMDGAIVSNVPLTADQSPSHNGFACSPNMKTLTPNGIVIMVGLFSGGPVILDQRLLADTPLPLTLDQLRPRTGVRRSVAVTFHGIPRYGVTAWLGAGASPADRASADAVLGTIRPWAPPEPDPRYGECVGGWMREPASSVGDLGSKLDGVAASSATDVWAVGDYTHTIPTSSSPPRLASTPLALHWDGASWTLVPVPDPALEGSAGSIRGGSNLRAVAAIAADDAWAVGGTGRVGLIEHWDGVRWSVVPSPKVNLVDTTLVGVAGTGPDDAWAVGAGGDWGIGAVIEHWDGKGWTISPIPDVGHRYTSAESVSASSSTDAWVVGQRWDRALTLHWDGNAWRAVESPRIRAQRLLSVVDLGPGDAWAVGATYRNVNGAGPAHALVEHWDGTRWRAVRLPVLPPTSWLGQVSASGPKDVWATGWGARADGTEVPLALHFDGSRWVSLDPPAPGPSTGWYEGLSATSGTTWLVGQLGAPFSYGRDQAYLAHTC